MTTEQPARPLPHPGLLDSAFWEYTKKHELRLQRCAICGKYRWPPAPICDQCLSPEFAWEKLSGEGEVLSWVTFHREYFPGLPTPYNCVMLELREGPLFVSNLAGVENAAIRFGMRVKVDFLDLPEGYTLPVFRPE